jgi:hypothetical protein
MPRLTNYSATDISLQGAGSKLAPGLEEIPRRRSGFAIPPPQLIDSVNVVF